MNHTSHAPTSRSPGRPRSTETDRAIYQATIELLAEGGLPAITIEGVARKAGINRRSVYLRASGPVPLIIAAFKDLVQDDTLPDTGRAFDDLLEIARMTAALYQSKLGSAINELGLLARRYPEAAEELQKQVVEPRIRSFTQVVQRAIDRGELSKDTDPRLLFDLLGGAIWSRVVRRSGPLNDAVLRQLVAAIVGGSKSP